MRSVQIHRMTHHVIMPLRLRRNAYTRYYIHHVLLLYTIYDILILQKVGDTHETHKKI